MSNDTSSPDPGDNGSNRGGGGGGGAQPTNYPNSGGGGNAADGNGGASGFDTRTVDFAYDGWTISGNGYASITYTGKTAVDTTVTRNTIISGSTTKTLTLTSDQVGIQTVACSVSSDVATNSPLISNTENFVVRSTAEEYLVNIEGINNTDTANLTRVDLFNGEYEFTTSTGDPTQNAFIREYSFYSPDKDLNVEMDLYGGKGADFGSRSGGEGGFSRIRFTMAKNVEYVLAGLIEAVNAPFLYRKATLIACVGEGGDAGFESAGGFGGGINVAGENGSGVDGGNGGDLVAAGTLPSNGYYGTLTSLTPVTPDTTSNEPQGGGRTIPCARGVYWRDQGKAPCDDLGTIKFRNSDGTEVTNTAEITRGYKSGYNIIQTKGLGETFANAGDGGTGAMGGKGGRKGYGGGGGSGYTDDSVTVVSTQQGGSEFTTAKVILRIVTRTIQKVTFTQSRTTNENIGFDLTLQSGNGPQTITFGSKAGFSGTLPSTVTADIEEGSIYTITRTNNVDTRTLSDDGTLNVSDTDSNPGSLSVKPDKGRWTDTNTYEFTT